MCKKNRTFVRFFSKKQVKKLIPYITIVASMLVWAASGIAVKAALSLFTPLSLIVMRFTGAVLLMLIIGLIFRHNGVLGIQKIEKKDVWLFALGGLFQPFLYFIFETYTYKALASVTIAEAFLSTSPIIAPIFAWLFLREQVTKYNIMGILISTIGMLILVLVGSTDFALGNPWGLALAFLSVSMAVGYSVVLKKIPAHYSSLSVVFYTQLFSLCLFYPVWCIVDSPTMWWSQISVWTPALISALQGVGYLMVMSSVLAFILFCYSVRYIGVTRANAFNNIRPVFTALIMLIVMGEMLPFWKWIGIFIIIAGLFICQIKEPCISKCKS